MRQTILLNHVKTLSNNKKIRFKKTQLIKIYSQDSQKYSNTNNKYNKNIRVETQFLTAK